MRKINPNPVQNMRIVYNYPVNNNIKILNQNNQNNVLRFNTIRNVSTYPTLRTINNIYSNSVIHISLIPINYDLKLWEQFLLQDIKAIVYKIMEKEIFLR